MKFNRVHVGISRLLFFFVIALAIGCSHNRNVETVDYHRFLKEQDCSFGDTPDEYVDAMLYNAVFYDSGQYIFVYKGHFLVFDFADSVCRFFDKGNAVHNIIASPDTGSVWYIEYRNRLCEAKSGFRSTFRGTIPFYDSNFTAVPYRQLPFVDGRIYTSVFTSLKKELIPVDQYQHWPHAAIWHIEGDTVLFDTVFGTFPENYPYDNEGTAHLSHLLFNPDDSIIVFYSDMMSTVSLYSLNGKFISEKYLGSSHFISPEKLTIEDYLDQDKCIEWKKSNTLYQTIVYDPYRDVYLRPMRLPSRQDPDALELSSDNWIMVVADRNFNVKYEVLFDNDSYRVASRVLPTPQGVYVEKKLTDTEIAIDKFVFE